MSALRDNTAAGLVHPEWVDGRKLWIAPEVQEVIDWMHYGYAPLGWEGDPALALYLGEKNEWVVNRYEKGEYHTVCKSKPGVELNLSLIMGLVDMDTRRKSAEKILDQINAHNDALQARISGAAHEKMCDAMEKVYWGVAKEVGHHY